MAEVAAQPTPPEPRVVPQFGSHTYLDEPRLHSRWAWPVLALLILSFTVVFTIVNWWRMQALRQGFDFMVYAQPIWNTIHGRPFAQSMYSFAPTHLGVDLAWFELWIAPFYAIKQSPNTLFLLISLGAALGAWPLYLIARARFGVAAALGWAALYLLFLPLGAITVSEFQPRLFAASALLGAYWFYRRNQATGFWLCLLLALSVRTDVGLVVGMLGVLGLIERRRAAFSIVPLVVGFGYWALAVFVIIPALANGHGFLWQVNYAWLGPDTRAILQRIFTDPLYTVQGIFTLEKLRYLAQLLWPLGFLPLLRPRLFLVAAPILALNLLSGEIVQFDLFHQYQALILPFLFLAAIEGLADLQASAGKQRMARLLVLGLAAVAVVVVLLPVWVGNADSRNGLHPSFMPLAWLILLAMLAAPVVTAYLLEREERRWFLPGVIGCLIVLMLLQHLAMGSEVLRFVKSPRPSPRLPAAQALIAQVPSAAPLAVTSQLAILTPLRQQLYHFPGNSSYDPALVTQARYVLGDRLRDDRRENADIERLIGSGNWRVVAERDSFVLLERITR